MKLAHTTLLLPLLALSPAPLVAAQGLPPAPQPPENPVTPEKALLGKLLFFEEQFSSDGTMACATCHLFEHGGHDPRVAVRPGVDGVAGTADDVLASPGMVHSDVNRDFSPAPVFGLGRQATVRQAPSFVMASYMPRLTWIGAARGQFVDPQTGLIAIQAGGALESSASLSPLVGLGMAHDGRTWEDVAAKLAVVTPLRTASNLPPDLAAALASSPTYPELYEAAFGTPEIDARRTSFAIASYERTLVPDQSPWDLFVAGDAGALSADEQAGLALFEGAAGCYQCHPAPVFSDGGLHNTGLRDPALDPGAVVISGDLAHLGAFKTPSLRNAGLRTRFFHTGEHPSLEAVVDYYDAGGGPHALNKDPLLVPLGLTPLQKSQLVAFVRVALTDPRMGALEPPFDRPTLFSESGVPEPFGVAGPGSGGFAPRILGRSPLSINNPSLRIGVADALGGALAIWATSTSLNPPGTTAFGVEIHVGLAGGLTLVPLVLAGAGAGNGYGTVHVPTPNDPGLVGVFVVSQWFVLDPGAPEGLASSRAVADQLF